MFAPNRKTFNNFDLVVRDKYETKSKIKSNLSKQMNLTNTFINATSRQRLYEVLSIKYSRMYNFKDLNEEIEKEILLLLKKETIVEADLKELDRKINSLSETFNNINKHFDLVEENKKNPEANLPKVLSKSASYVETRSNKGENLHTRMSTKMSGGSSLSLLFNKNVKMKEEIVKSVLEKKKQELQVKPKKLPYNIDDWNSVMRYNKKLFEEEKKMKKFHQKQLQEIMKNQLDQQQIERFQNKKANFIEDKDYHEYLVKNCELKEKEEKMKEEERKNKLAKEKQITDKLLEMDRERKKNERMREKQLDKQINKPNNYLEKQKELMKEIKKKEIGFYQEVEKEENLGKSWQKKKKQEERAHEINNIEELAKMFDKMENDRKIERMKAFKNQTFDMEAINQMKMKLKQDQVKEDQIMRKFEKEQDLLRKKEDQQKQLEKIEKIKEMKRSLNEQLQYKKMRNEFDQKLDKEQGKIWNKDDKIYLKKQDEINNTIKLDRKKNSSLILDQIKENQVRKQLEKEISPPEEEELYEY